MIRNAIALAVVCGLLVADSPALVGTAGAQTPKPPSIDAVLAAYAKGEVDVVSRSFLRAQDFQLGLRLNRPREFEEWLGPWDRVKAVLVLDLVNVALRTGPQVVSPLTNAGRRYVMAARADAKTSADVAAIESLWHRTAVGLLMRFGNPVLVENHIEELTAAAKEGGRSLDPRLILALATAKETRCWEMRPTLEFPGPELVKLTGSTGVRIAPDLQAPRAEVVRMKFERHHECLQEAAVKFEAAAALEETRAEALIRASWALFLGGRAREAAEKLQTANPGGDKLLGYWKALFLGRALSALGRPEDAMKSYQQALSLFPEAQSAGIGLALELSKLRRPAEASDMAQKLTKTVAVDPWRLYAWGDERFVDDWLVKLRAGVR